MICIHSTKKLWAKLPLNDQGELPEAEGSAASENIKHPLSNPLSHWHGNLITLQRRHCILLVHDATRLGLFIPCLTKPDFATLQWHFNDVFMNTLLKIGANEQQMKAAESLLQPLVFDTQCDRSVQGTMNRMKGDIEHMLNFEQEHDQIAVQDLSSYRVSAWLAERPCNIKSQKKFVLPIQEMLALLGSADTSCRNGREVDAPHLPLDTSLPDNVVTLADYRKAQQD